MSKHNSPIFNNTYASLPERFFARIEPTKVSDPELIRSNSDLAKKLGIDLDWLESEEGIYTVAGNFIPEGPEPIATVYAGHQFGNWNPQLGDGRAVLLGEVLDDEGQRFDLQLKGSGPTPFSRGGDGRAPLGPVLREYIVSEAMHALGIPTTRALACVTTGETIYRGVGAPSAVLARVAQSHIRIGHFQFFASRGDEEGLRILADHVIGRHYSQIINSGIKSSKNPYKLLFEAVIKKQAELIARWQLVGFIHGVMNTDNMLLSGETIDYGPCAFMDVFDPAKVYSSIDQNGRYAYNNQPNMAHWNLMCLGQALLPLFDQDQNIALASVQESLDTFPDQFEPAYQTGMNQKLGLAEYNESGKVLCEELLELMHKHELDFTLTFRCLSELVQDEFDQESISPIFEFPEVLQPWLQKWRAVFDQDETDPVSRQSNMLSTNPAYIPRNHLIEEAIKSAEFDQDYSAFHTMVDLLAKPYALDKAHLSHAETPRSDQMVLATFCGT